MQKIIFTLSFLILLGACGTKQYRTPEGATTPLSLDVKYEGSTFMSDSFYLYIWEERPDCERKFLGLTEAPNQKITTIMLPTGLELLVVVDRTKAAPLGSYSTTASFYSRMQVHKGSDYKLTYKERNGSKRVTFMEKASGKKEFVEFDTLDPRDCENLKVTE